MRVQWLAAVIQRFGLPVWFGVFAAVHFLDIVPEGRIGFDARIYRNASAAWLAGGDPWSAAISLPEGPFHFAGLPPTVLAFAPVTLVPEGWTGVIGFLVAAVAAIWIVRRLGLPLWWLLFPPLVQGVLLGQPGIFVLALLLTRLPLLEALAAALKIYALLPLLSMNRSRGVLAVALLFTASLILASDLWIEWASQSAAVANRLVDEVAGGVGMTAEPWLVPLTVLALVVIARFDRRATGWLAVPAVWPSSQFHYPVMALPVIRALPAAAFAVPIPGMSAVAVLLHAWLVVRDAGERSRQPLRASANSSQVGRD